METLIPLKDILLILVLSLSILLISGTYSENYKIKFAKAYPTIIDSLSVKTIERERNWISKADYDILYIGRYKDSIYVNRKHNVFRDYIKYGLEPYEKYEYCTEVKIHIEVDTSQFVIEDAGFELDEVFEDKKENTYFKAYPVVIKHSFKKPIIIGQTGLGEQLPLILEALDSKGKWRPIEVEPTYMCGFGIEPIILPPNKIILTGVTIYKGKFETKLRLRAGKNYSNTFLGTINPKQFRSIFKENGDYSDDYKRARKQN